MSQDEKPPERRRMVRPPTGGTAAGRGMGQKIRTADKKSLSSQEWIKRQLADKFSEKARAEGWRSRAAFKLTEIDDRLHLIKTGSRVIDLGAAPGGWVQVALKRGATAVAGVEPCSGGRSCKISLRHSRPTASGSGLHKGLISRQDSQVTVPTTAKLA